MKKIIVALLCLTMAVSMAACGSKTDDTNKTDSTSNTTTSAATEVPATPTPVEPNATYDLTGGVTKSAEELAVMFDYWTEGFDSSIVAKVTADGYFFFIDCDNDGKIGEGDITYIKLVNESGISVYSVTIDLSGIEEAKQPKADDVIHIEGTWKHNTNTFDQSDFRLYVESISEGTVPELDWSAVY